MVENIMWQSLIHVLIMGAVTFQRDTQYLLMETLLFGKWLSDEFLHVVSYITN